MCVEVELKHVCWISISILDLLLLFRSLARFFCRIWFIHSTMIHSNHRFSFNNNSNNTKHLQHKRNELGKGERENIGIYVTCCDIIYLFDRCFPVFRCVLTCRKGGRAWEIKSSSIILCDSVSDF